MRRLTPLIILLLLHTGCLDPLHGRRVGYINRLSQRGLVFPSWECRLDPSPYGTPTLHSINLSLDNDRVNHRLLDTLRVAYLNTLPVEVQWHYEKFGNLFMNRGLTDMFIDSVRVLR